MTTTESLSALEAQPLDVMAEFLLLDPVLDVRALARLSKRMRLNVAAALRMPRFYERWTRRCFPRITALPPDMEAHMPWYEERAATHGAAAAHNYAWRLFALRLLQFVYTFEPQLRAPKSAVVRSGVRPAVAPTAAAIRTCGAELSNPAQWTYTIGPLHVRVPDDNVSVAFRWDGYLGADVNGVPSRRVVLPAALAGERVLYADDYGVLRVACRFAPHPPQHTCEVAVTVTLAPRAMDDNFVLQTLVSDYVPFFDPASVTSAAMARRSAAGAFSGQLRGALASK